MPIFIVLRNVSSFFYLTTLVQIRKKGYFPRIPQSEERKEEKKN